jgi:aminomethyltransferase
MLTTPLHSSHLEQGAKLGEFAGYDMPLYYKLGVIKEHEWVRSKCGIFDVSHMRQIIFSGEGARELLEQLTPSSYEKTPHGRAKYTVLCNERGGIIDDLIVTKVSDDRFFAVINAGCRDKDMEWIQQNNKNDVEIECLDDRALIAVQGPLAEKTLNKIFNIDTKDIPYMWMIPCSYNNEHEVFISRVGYTGEDGFEISIHNNFALELWEKLIQENDVFPIGLAARDSLRLEMGYCLYGHDINENTSPIEANLGWVISKNNHTFIGHDVVRDHASNGTEKTRTGIILIDKGVAREDCKIYDENGKEIGHLTSGSFSPTLKKSIGQCYIDRVYSEKSSPVLVDVRGRKLKAEIADLPLLQAKTKSMKKQAA